MSKNLFLIILYFSTIVLGIDLICLKQLKAAEENAFQSIEYYLKKGRKYASEGKFEESEAEFRKALEIEESNRSAGANLEVISDFKKGKINYNYTLHYFKGINYLYNDNEILPAIEEFNKAIKINPDYANAYHNLGIAYGFLGQHQLTINYLQKAIQIDPHNANAYYNLGFAYDSLGQYPPALQYYEKTTQLNPNYTDAYINSGIIYHSLGQHQQAISCYEKAIQINPNEANAYNNMGNTYNSLGLYREAITYLQKAIEINPTHSNTWYNLGISYKALGRSKQAISSYEKALQINPYRSDALYNLGNLYNSLGQYQQAITHYTKSIQIDPNQADAYIGLGVAYKSLGQPQQAITYYKKALQIDPNDATAYNNLGKTYNSLGQHQQAIAYYEKAISIDANDAEAYNNLGGTYGLLGQHEQSLTYFKKAIQIDPNYADAYNNLGTAYFYLRQYREAKENFQKAKELFQKAGDLQRVQEIDEDLKRLPFAMGFIKTMLQLGIFWGIFWIVLLLFRKFKKYNEECDKAEKDYEAYLESIKNSLKISAYYLSQDNFHDAIVESVSKPSQDELVIELDARTCWGGLWEGIRKIVLTFKGVKILEFPGKIIEKIIGSTWLDQRVYLSDIAAFDCRVFLTCGEVRIAADDYSCSAISIEEEPVSAKESKTIRSVPHNVILLEKGLIKYYAKKIIFLIIVCIGLICIGVIAFKFCMK